ncbi:MAG: hypothetical protein AABW53_01555 [Nanoarchaeota archaeon]
MSIWLERKRIEDLVKIPLYLGSGRLNVEPNKDNHVYDLYGHYIHYSVISAEKDLKIFGWGHISKQIARNIPAEHIFVDASFDRQRFDYWSVELWEKIPPEFRDIFFFHEAVESINRGNGMLQSKACALASDACGEYLAKYLAAEEQAWFAAVLGVLESNAKLL